MPPTIYFYGGLAGDVPVVGDWNGAGTSCIGIFRNGQWILDTNCDGAYDSGDRTYSYGGLAGDLPVVGKWQPGNAKSLIGVYRGGTWILDSNGNYGSDSGDLNTSLGGVSGDLPVVGSWTPAFQASVAVPALSINGGSNNGETLPNVTIPLTFGLYDPRGPSDIGYAQFYLADSSGGLNCYGDWGPPAALDLFDAGVGAISGFNISQSDSFCTVSLASITRSATDPTEETVVLNFTFSPASAGTYSVMQQVDYVAGGGSPWLNLGNLIIDLVPDSPPPGYPNYIGNLPRPSPVACNITGNWADSLSTGIWALNQPDNTVNGSFSLSSPSCGTVTWAVSGAATSGVAQLNASAPFPAVDLCGIPAGTNAAIVTLSSCSTGLAHETQMDPGYINSFGQQVPPRTVSGNGIWTLGSPQLTFNVGSTANFYLLNPASPILLSTGDTNVPITITASNCVFRGM